MKLGQTLGTILVVCGLIAGCSGGSSGSGTSSSASSSSSSSSSGDGGAGGNAGMGGMGGMPGTGGSGGSACVLGSGTDCPAKSCLDVFTHGSTIDGYYVISPLGGAPVRAWCDMANDGVGWTLVVNISGTSQFQGDNADAVGDFDDLTLDAKSPSFPGNTGNAAR